MKKHTKLFTMIFSTLLILFFCLGSILLLRQKRFSQLDRIETVRRESLKIDAALWGEYDIGENLMPDLLNSDGSSQDSGTKAIEDLDEAFVHSLNRFLSYFSEQNFSAYPTANNDTEALLDFSYFYYKIHNSELLGSSGYADVLPAERADTALQDFFGIKISHQKSKYLYHMANNHRCRNFSIITAISQDDKGCYTVRFDTYEILNKDPDASVPEEYYDLHDLAARKNTSLLYCATGSAKVESVSTDLCFRLLEYHSGTAKGPMIREYSSSDVYRINGFLSTFSEQLFKKYDPADTESLLNFACRYLVMNHPDRITPSETNQVTIQNTDIDYALNRYFGTTISHTHSEYQFPRAENSFRHYYTVATNIECSPDGNILTEFNVYALVGAHQIPEEYYWYTQEEAEKDWFSVYCGSGTAELQDCTDESASFYHAVSYGTNDLTPPYTPRLSDIAAEGTYLFTYLSQSTSSNLPPVMEMLRLQEAVVAACSAPLNTVLDLSVNDLQFNRNYFQDQGDKLRFAWRMLLRDPYSGGYSLDTEKSQNFSEGFVYSVDYQLFSSYYMSLFGEVPDANEISGQPCTPGYHFTVENGLLYGSKLYNEETVACLKRPSFSYDSSKGLYVITMDLLSSYYCTEENGEHKNVITFPYMEYSDVNLMFYPEETVMATVQLYLYKVDGQYRYHSCILLPPE